MVYKKRYIKKQKSAPKTRAIARQEVKKVLAREIETKNFYSRQTAFGVNYSGAVFPLLLNPSLGNWLLQGTGKDAYVGDTIAPTGIAINYSVVSTLSSAVTYGKHRILVLQVNGGGTPNPVNVLQSVGNGLTPQSHYDANYRETFRVLYDRMHTTMPVANPLSSGKVYIPGSKLRKINFLANTAQNTTAGNIFIVYFSDSSNTTSSYLEYQARVMYKDA